MILVDVPAPPLPDAVAGALPFTPASVAPPPPPETSPCAPGPPPPVPPGNPCDGLTGGVLPAAPGLTVGPP